MQPRFRISKPSIREFLLRILIVYAILTPLVPLRGLVTPADHEGYLEFVEKAEAGAVGEELSSKQYIGSFFNLVMKIMPYWVFTNAVFFIYLFYMAMTVRTLSAYCVALVVTLPMFIHFNYISKEAVFAFVVVSGMLVTSCFGRNAGYFTFIAGIVAFAALVRPYYAIPIAATFLVFLLGKKRGFFAIVLGFVLCVVIFPLPIEVLESQRIQMRNASLEKFGTRTVYPNVDVASDLPVVVQAMKNYLFVAVETLFPLSWVRGVKDVYAQLFVIAMLVLINGALRFGDRVFSSFGVFLILTVPFFSPDLGTTVRHVSAAAICMTLGMAFQKIVNEVPPVFRPFSLRPIYI